MNLPLRLRQLFPRFRASGKACEKTDGSAAEAFVDEILDGMEYIEKRQDSLRKTLDDNGRAAEPFIDEPQVALMFSELALLTAQLDVLACRLKVLSKDVDN